MVHGNLGGPALTAKGDPRVTRAGRVLRKTKLDELPQLWNVLVGEMSLVGPRPEAPRYVNLFREDYDVILSVRPGVTDEASIVYRNEEALLGNADDPERTYVEEILPKKIALAKDYVKTRGLSSDVRILVRTVIEVVTK
jgi:lipopolysaccharide/colanic/teichoic acid biosynthesis glycosyltransferase